MTDNLIELAKQVRGGTLELLHAAHSTWLTWAPPGTSNHILWHAGHALWLQDVLCVKPLCGRSEIPAEWPEVFGQHCRPVAGTRFWPSREEIAERLENQLTRILELLRNVDLQQAARKRSGGWPLVDGIIHGFHDEARHQGEMYLLFKLCRARFTA